MLRNKNVAIVSPFVNPFVFSNSRVLSISEMLIKNGYRPIIITTNFNHSSKSYYNSDESEGIYPTLLLNVPSYRKNLSVKRIVSHIVFAYKVRTLIKRDINNYSFIYCTAPSSFAPYLLSKLCKKKKVPFVLDVIDLWPQSYFVFFGKFVFLAKILLHPWTIISRSSYKYSSLVIAESKEYASFVTNYRKDKVEGYYLGIDIKHTEEICRKSNLAIPKKGENEIWVGYGGSLNNSYDFDVIINTFSKLKSTYLNTKLIFVGGGELEQEIKKRLQDEKINGIVTGYLPYSDYLNWLSKIDIAINSFKKGTKVVHSYKFNDYIATGCCVINNLKGETWEMVNKFNIGLNFDYENNSFEEALSQLLSNPQIIIEKCKNTETLAKGELSKELIYNRLYKSITEHLNN